MADLNVSLAYMAKNLEDHRDTLVNRLNWGSPEIQGVNFRFKVKIIEHPHKGYRVALPWEPSQMDVLIARIFAAKGKYDTNGQPLMIGVLSEISFLDWKRLAMTTVTLMVDDVPIDFFGDVITWCVEFAQEVGIFPEGLESIILERVLCYVPGTEPCLTAYEEEVVI